MDSRIMLNKNIDTNLFEMIVKELKVNSHTYLKSIQIQVAMSYYY